MKTKDLIVCSLFSAITCILAQISIPFIGGVPLTMQTLAVSLSGIILGAKKGFISQCIYILLGCVGMPVFAEFSGGLQVVFGPTGGFILSFPLMAFVIGYICEKTNKKHIFFLAMIVGSILNYVGGVIQFMIVTKSDLISAISACVIPFLFTGLVKALLATIIGSKIIENKSLKGVLNI